MLNIDVEQCFKAIRVERARHAVDQGGFNWRQPCAPCMQVPLAARVLQLEQLVEQLSVERAQSSGLSRRSRGQKSSRGGRSLGSSPEQSESGVSEEQDVLDGEGVREVASAIPLQEENRWI